jgi:SOS-response transcriptional repressor LexA
LARKRNSNSKSNVKAQISVRLRQIRLELFGEHGGPELARRLDLPARTWYNYETGVTVPAEVMLNFIDQTGIYPAWLLTGEGEVFRDAPPTKIRSDLAPLQMIHQALELLELESKAREQNDKLLNHSVKIEHHNDFISLPLIGMDEVPGYESTPMAQRDQFLVYSKWVPCPTNSVCLRVNSHAMSTLIPNQSVVVVDLNQTNPLTLNGKVVVGLDQKNQAIIRRLEHSGDHVILRAERSGREFPMITYTLKESQSRIIGEVVAVNSPIDV